MSGASSSSVVSPADSPASATMAGTLKRRWATNPPLTTDVDLGGDEANEAKDGAEVTAEEGESMEMDGMDSWDGRGERPGKRLSVRGLGGGRDSLGV